MAPMESASSLVVSENTRAGPTPVLEEGKTCWRLAPAERAAVLYDGAEYFAALRSSMLAAERSIFILGWELHSRMRLEGTHRPRDGAPAELGRFLRWLLRHRPRLEIRILLWNHPVVYSVQRELFPLYIFGRRKPRRTEIVLDSRLPIGAAHHEKLVVIDDSVAFCGGMDLTVRRWDTCAHHPAEPRRRYRSRTPYAPTHDVQMVVAGDAAAALGTRARDRWHRAGGAPCPDVAPQGNPWPEGVAPDFERVTVGIMRTRGALADGTEEIREIERCTAAALARAERLVYIENQYVTAVAASEALRDRMRAVPSLHALVVTTREPGGWLEARTMGVGRQRFMRAFEDEALVSRIRFVAPIVRCPALRSLDEAEALSVHVHAKVLIVDDTFLRIGSSNLNNRSMGFDTECDLAIEAVTPEHRAAIARVRNRLIAEHWGSDAEAVERAAERDDVGSALEHLPVRPVHSTARGLRALPVTPLRRAARAPATRSVVPIDRDDAPGETPWVVQLGDPERVVSAEELIAQTVGVTDPTLLRRAATALAVVAVVALGLFAASAAGFGLDDVRGLGSRLLETIESLGRHPWGVPSVVAVFVVGSLIAVPILAMIGATVLALGPLLGFVCSAVGVLLAAAATFGAGRLLGRDALRRWLGERLTSLEKRLARHGVLAVALVRKVPVAPFTIVNMLIGAIGFRFRDFMFGTALGMLPGIAAFSFLSDRVIDAWREPTTTNVLLIGAAVVVWLGVVLGVQQLVNRRTRS
jgi:phospholipase D1/2